MPSHFQNVFLTHYKRRSLDVFPSLEIFLRCQNSEICECQYSGVDQTWMEPPKWSGWAEQRTQIQRSIWLIQGLSQGWSQKWKPFCTKKQTSNKHSSCLIMIRICSWSTPMWFQLLFGVEPGSSILKYTSICNCKKTAFSKNFLLQHFPSISQ